VHERTQSTDIGYLVLQHMEHRVSSDKQVTYFLLDMQVLLTILVSNGVFDNTGNRYNVSLAVNQDSLFDKESYLQYSPA
jgi:hypothetical protein